MKAPITSNFALGIAFAALTAVPSFAALIAYDGFSVPDDYTDGISTQFVNGGTGWTTAWNNPGFDADSASATYPDLATSAGSAVIISNFDFNTTSRSFSPVSTGDLWVSWLYTPGNPGADYSGLGLSRTGGGEIFYIGTNGNGQLRIDATNAGGSDNASVTPITSGQTYFIVANINYGAGTFDVYVNPSVVGGPGTPTISATSGSLGEVGSLLTLGLGNGVTSFDEIRLGTSYVDVAPTAVPEPSAYAALIGIGALGFVALRRRRA